MKNIYTNIARNSIEFFLTDGKKMPLPSNLPVDLINKKAGVFVSLHLKNPKIDEEDLRGCIGTIAPTKENIAEEIIDNAIAASSNDYRFSPVTKEELDGLEISVDILGKPEKIKDISELNTKKYGVIVKSKDGKTGLLLPDIETVDTPEYQVAIAKQKAGISDNEPVQLYRFIVKRYEEKNNLR